MSGPGRWWPASGAALVVCAALLYGHRLEYAPPHVEIDEVLIALDAHAIATTGRDLRGEFLPLYSQTAEHSWYQPFVIYVTAAVLKVLPFTEHTIRLPTVAIGVINIPLMYFVARSLFASPGIAAIAAAFLALTPAHFIHSRYGMDYIYPVPFVLGWLLCLVRYNERRRDWLLVAASAVLGVGFYSYIASIVMMPLYVVLTCLMLAWQKAPRRSRWIAAAAFLPWLIPFVVWLALHPSAYGATVVKYGLYDPAELNAAQGLRAAISYASISQRVSQYWNFFNPSTLFFGGGILLMFSTNLVGVFLLPLAAFLSVGLYQAVRRVTPMGLLLFVGFVTAPLATLIVSEPNAIFRALPLLPFTVLLAAMGVQYLWSPAVKPLRPVYPPLGAVAAVAGAAYAAWTLAGQSRISRSSLPLAALGVGLLLVGRIQDRTRQWRVATICLLALMPVQFGLFWSDYFSDYRVRSSSWLGGNIRGALEEIIERDRRDRAPGVYFSPLRATSGQLDVRNQYMDEYWRFYLVKHRREDLLERTFLFEAEEVRTLPPGSLVLANQGDVTMETLVKGGELRQVAAIPELDGSTFFVVLQR